MPFTFHHTATPEIYTLSLHDALPICGEREVLLLDLHALLGLDRLVKALRPAPAFYDAAGELVDDLDLPVLRSEEHTSEPSHPSISYAVFCLKKKKNTSSDRKSSPHTR